jgi:hypothetical protein
MYTYVMFINFYNAGIKIITQDWHLVPIIPKITKFALQIIVIGNM